MTGWYSKQEANKEVHTSIYGKNNDINFEENWICIWLGFLYKAFPEKEVNAHKDVRRANRIKLINHNGS